MEESSRSSPSKEAKEDAPLKDTEQQNPGMTAGITTTKKSGRTRRRERKLKNEPTNVVADTAPDALRVVDFLEARVRELSAMVHAVTNKGGAKRTFQKLPRHMRRRAASFNARRLPHRVRESAINEVKWVWSLEK